MKKIIAMILVAMMALSMTGAVAEGGKLAAIQEAGKLVVATDAAWAPFEYIYNSNLRDEMDADIFQVPHHGVGSASVGAKYGTVNNKHLAVISPSSIIVPAGRTVPNMVLSGSRAIREKVKQLDGSMDYDGLYGLYIDFGIVDAAGGMGKTVASEADYKAIQTDGEKYWLAGWLNPSDYENTKSAICFFTNVDDRVYENAPQMSDTLVARVDVEAGQKGCGIRYTSRVFADTVEVLNTLKSEGAITGYSFGTVIFEDENVAAAADPAGMVTAESLKAAGREYVDVPAVNGISTKKDANGKIYYEFRAALVKIKATNVQKKFAAVSYIQYTLVSGETVRTYTMYDGEDRSGTMEDVAFMSLADLKTVPSVVDGYKFENLVNYTYQLVGKQYRKSTLQTPMYSAYNAQEWLLLEAYLQ